MTPIARTERGQTPGQKIGHKLGQVGQLLTGLILGGLLTVGGLAAAGKLKPPGQPEALVALAQSIDTTDKQVDIMLERGDVAGAIGALETLRKNPWPSRERGGDAALQLRHDAYGRLSRLRLDHPQIDPLDDASMLSLVDEGLTKEWEQLEPNAFTAYLLALRGEILENLGRDGDALLVYEQALDMNRDLLEEIVGGGAR